MRPFVLLAPLFVSGCTLATSCTLFNNSGRQIAIDVTGPDGTAYVLSLAPGASAKIDHWVFSDVRISTSDETWTYATTDPDESFIRYPGFFLWVERRFRAQLQADGRIFVVAPDATFPQAELPPQPYGFPLEPARCREEGPAVCPEGAS